MVYVTGSLAFDFIMDFPGRFADQIIADKIHQINISFLVNSLTVSRGGTSANIAYNLGLFSVHTSIVACCGKDFGEYRDFLTKSGIDCSYIREIKSLYTARAFITTDKSDNQITGFYPGALVHDKDLKIPKCAGKDDLVIVAPTDPEAMDSFVRQCIERRIPFLFDFGMQLPRLSLDTLVAGMENAMIVVANDYEMALLKSKIKRPKDQETKGSRGQITVTTLGEKGCYIEKGKEKVYVPAAKPEKVIDPTGAGDAFRAGFITGFLGGKSLQECGRMGNLCAVYTVEKFGTTTHRFNLREFRERYKKNYGEKYE